MGPGAQMHPTVTRGTWKLGLSRNSALKDLWRIRKYFPGKYRAGERRVHSVGTRSNTASTGPSPHPTKSSRGGVYNCRRFVSLLLSRTANSFRGYGTAGCKKGRVGVYIGNAKKGKKTERKLNKMERRESDPRHFA